MADNSSLYGTTTPSGTVASSNYTTLYSGGNNFVPSGDNVIISGTLTVNGCAILTDCPTFSLLPLNATTINFGGSATAVNIGASTGQTTILNQLATANYTFPVADGVSGQVLVTDGAGTVSFAPASTVGKTYSINASATTGGANFNLVSSDPSTDTIKFANGTGVTVTRTDADTITFAIGQDVATTANPVFAGVTGGNVTVGVATDNTIATTTGNLNIVPESTSYTEIFSSAATPTIITRNTTTTNAFVRTLALNLQSTGTPTVGFGNALDFQVEAQPGNTERAGYVSVVSTDLTAGSEDFRMNFGLMQNGATYANRLSLFSNGDLNMYNGGTFGILGLTSGFTKLVAPATGSNLTYVLPGAAGAANTVLTNDGSGNLSWALPGGGGSTFGNITIAVADDNTISTTTGDLKLDSASGTIEMIGIVDINGDYINLNSDNTAVDSAMRFNAGAEILYNYANSRFDISKGINVDSGVLFVDATNNRVGINNTSPQYELHIDQGADGFTQFGMTTAERTALWTMNDGDDLLSLSYGTTPGTTNRLIFDPTNQWFVTGNTGINTATPAYTLDVNGTGNFQGVITGGLKINGSTSGYSNFIAPTTGSNLNYTLPGAAGAANTVLTNDGSGNLSWALPGGGGSTFGNITVGVVTDNTISTTTGDLVLASATNVIDATTATINANILTVDSRASIDSVTITTTSTSTVQLVETTRNVMKNVIYIVQGANVHTVEALVLRVDATTALLTTYGEMYNTSALATFTADVSAGDLRLLVTPASATSTVFSVVRTSLD